MVSNQDKILALTMGLPSSYNTVIINFNSTPSDQLTLSHVISCLLNEEVHQISGSKLSDNNDAEEVQDEAMAVIGQDSGGQQAGGGNPSDVICFFCDKKGHYKSDCPNRLAWEKVKKKNGLKDHIVAFLDENNEDSDGVRFF